MSFRKLAIVILPLALAACSTLAPTDVKEPPGDITDPPKKPLEPARPFNAAELEVATANNEFGVALLKQVARTESKPNVLLSPLSASMALGMTMNGAEGTTYDAMRATLGFGTMQEAAINEAYRGLIAQLRARDSIVDFRLANAIFHRAGFAVKAPFLDAAKTFFDAHVSAMNFSDPNAPKTISAWAEQQTGGRIKNLVEQIDPLDMVFLINAVYFKAPWAKPFEPAATRPADFTRANGSRVSVPTMMQDGAFPFVSNSEVKAVELPYANGAYSMVLVTPANNVSLAQFIANLTPARWNAYLAAMNQSRVMLFMPKFKFEYDITMNDALIAMGMGVAFDARLANFDRIHNQTRDDLYISKVKQKAFIDVHELGTEAAAATSVTISVTSMPPELRFDKPFLFAIRERTSGTILFAGRVGDPSS